MLTAVDNILQDACGLDKKRAILAGVSGGPDSLCLLSALHETGWQVVAAHYNHGLRPEADEEASAVGALASRMGIPFVGARGDVREHAAQNKLSIETAARELRYRFLFAQAEHVRAQAVAVGHTADDQVETILMHVVRGAALNGLKGMTYRSQLTEFHASMPLVRPLLDTWRSETLAYCAAHDLTPHFDPSNASLEFMRNRVRHELIPMLESYNPRAREAVLRLGQTASAEHELLMQVLEPLWRECLVAQGDGYISLSVARLAAQPTAAQMHLLRRAAAVLRPGYDMSRADLERAAAFIADESIRESDFAGGLVLLREHDLVHLTADERALPRGQWPQLPVGTDAMPFAVPGAVPLAAGWSMEADWCDASSLQRNDNWPGANPMEVFLDADRLGGELTLRIRHEGDRFEPLGMGGHSQKLSDFFVNEKMPQRARERWPLVCAGDTIAWVPGYRPAEGLKLRPDSTRALHLLVKPPI